MHTILKTFPLALQWQTEDPFLFCAHHSDTYPPANEAMGPNASLAGRPLGEDFGGIDGWRMYHGRTVPGFPQHPHRGFETITLPRSGWVDHADSTGATGRFGNGDVQWMTAGQGVLHSEMFPLLDRKGPNHTELFQIWLNLPAHSKMVAPHYGMYWSEDVPVVQEVDADGNAITVTAIAGTYADAKPLPPPPSSWAADPENDVAVWTMRLAAGARWELPAARAGLNRNLYFFAGASVRVAGQVFDSPSGIKLVSDQAVEVVSGEQEAELLLLQGRPIGEPVVQYGPFVMNSRVEIEQTFEEYRRTGFGGWPWPSNDPVHAAHVGRFAQHGDDRIERPGSA